MAAKIPGEPVEALTAEALCRYCDPGMFSFRNTDELEDLDRVIGQERVVEAIRFGVGIKSEGYNLFALGPPGTGKHTIVGQFLARAAQEEPVPDDWCYVNNFVDAQRPEALRLPPGRAAPFRVDMDGLVEELKSAIPAAFESDDYRSRRQLIESEFKERNEDALEKVQERAKNQAIALMRTPMGLAFAPVKDSEVIGPADFNKLSEEEQARIKDDIEALQEELQETLRKVPVWDKELRAKIRELNREVTQFAVGHLIDALKDKNRDLPDLQSYFEAVQADVVDNAPEFLGSAGQGEGMPQIVVPGQAPGGGGEAPDFQRYRVNVIVDNAGAEGAPVVYEDHPTLGNVIGRIEYTARFGALTTDFNLIRAGALHRANGGYLMLDARKLLLQPFAWEELKRTLRSKEIRVESLGQALSLINTVSLEPEPIPLAVKIVLVGDRMLYYLLSAHDPEFPALFKVPADFEDRMDLSPENAELYARLIATMARREALKPLDAGGVARVVEYGSRLAGDAERLSTHFRSIVDILREADYWAGQNGNGEITADDVHAAVEAKIHRSDRVRARVLEEIARGTILIDTDGEAVGQVNGLSVMQLGDFAFGQPSRITSRVRLGKGEVVDIERQVELGGPLHSKGVLILAGFLGARFASERPLSLSATLVFEQSYGGVDGDSASSAELYALLSALAEAPIKQSFAVTGSVNQHGQVQAIGGANEKIEGFFDLCRARGLTGEQGVLIPASNVKHLMLRRDVVEAARDGTFRIYPVATIDQGIALLTGVPAGERGADGTFPEGSINRRVEARLDHFAETARAFGRGPKEPNEPNGKEGGEA